MNSMHLLAFLPFLMGPGMAQELSWPGFRGPQRDGVARGAEPPVAWSESENLAWKVELPGGGSSSPIIVGDRVYVACYSGYGNILDDQGDPKDLVHHLVCIDRASGELIWDRAIPGPLTDPVPQVQLTEHGFASPTPVTDGDTICAYFGRAGIVAFDRNGNILWQKDLGKPSKGAPAATNAVMHKGKALSLRWGSAASPLLHDGMVIVNCSEESNSIRALDQKTGELVWKHESANLEGCATSPALVGPKQDKTLVMVLAGAVWGMSPKTGKLAWRVETGTRGGMSPTPVADEKIVYAFGGSGASHALRLGTLPTPEGKEPTSKPSSRIVWKGANVDIPSPVLHNGLLFLVDTKGIATVLNAKDGSQVQKVRLEGRTGAVYASPVVADGRMYIVSRKRGTFVYTADKDLKLLARNELDDKTQFNASPAVVGNQMFLRSDKRLYCITQTDPPR